MLESAAVPARFHEKGTMRVMAPHLARLVRCLGFCALGLFAMARPAVATPIQWSGNGHYYELIAINETWEDANSEATLLTYLGIDGHLATITSEAENSFVHQFIVAPGYAPSPEVGAAWIGGFQTPGATEPGGGWAWVTGETWSYTNWFPNQPDNGTPGVPDSYAHYWSNWDARWNDADSARTAFYVVEYSPATASVPDSGSSLILLGLTLLTCAAAPYLRRLRNACGSV